MHVVPPGYYRKRQQGICPIGTIVKYWVCPDQLCTDASPENERASNRVPGSLCWLPTPRQKRSVIFYIRSIKLELLDPKTNASVRCLIPHCISSPEIVRLRHNRITIGRDIIGSGI